LSRIVGTPAYQNMTIRNWNTTARLLELMERMRTDPSASPGRQVRSRSLPTA
jgi:hypothetical protein